MAVGGGGGGHLYSLNTTVLCLGQDFWISEGHLQILGDTPNPSDFYL